MTTLEQLAEKHATDSDWHYGTGEKLLEFTLDQLRALITEAVETVQGDPVAYVWEEVDIESRSIETGLLFATECIDIDADDKPLHHIDMVRLK